MTSMYSSRPPSFQSPAEKLPALAETRARRAASSALPGSEPLTATLSSMVSPAAGASVRLRAVHRRASKPGRSNARQRPFLDCVAQQHSLAATGATVRRQGQYMRMSGVS